MNCKVKYNKALISFLSSVVISKRNICANILFTGTGTSCNERFSKENFQTGFVVAGGEFLYYWNHQLIKFEEEKRFGL